MIHYRFEGMQPEYGNIVISWGNTLRRWSMRRILRRSPIPHHIWRRVTQQIAMLGWTQYKWHIYAS